MLSRLEDDAHPIARHLCSEYPFVSLCGKELNFIRPYTLPVVFADLVNAERKSISHLSRLTWTQDPLTPSLPFSLTYASSLSTPFQLSSRRLTGDGKIVHPVSAGSLGILSSWLSAQLEHSISTTTQGAVLRWFGVDYLMSSISLHVKPSVPV